MRPALIRRFRLLLTGVLLAGVLFVPALPLAAQGCSQCAEQVGQTPARTQAAYRKAIIAVALGATAVFTGALLTFRRFR